MEDDPFISTSFELSVENIIFSIFFTVKRIFEN